MPQKDGVQVVRELKEQGCRAKFIMISQVSSKEMVAKAYLAGVDFFISKPINLIEVRQVIRNVSQQMENERNLHTIQSVFAERQAAPAAGQARERQRRRIQPDHPQPAGHGRGEGGQGHYGHVPASAGAGTAGESGGGGGPVRPAQRHAQVHGAAGPPAVERGLTHLASLGVEDYSNEIFTQYASRLFPFQECARRWPISRGRAPEGKGQSKALFGRDAGAGGGGAVGRVRRRDAVHCRGAREGRPRIFLRPAGAPPAAPEGEQKLYRD